MATTKKTTTKARTTTKRKAAPAKKTVRKQTTRTTKPAAVKSFRLEKDRDNFMDTNLTNQSVYWLVLGVAVIAFASWMLKVQAEIQSIYDKIDVSTSSIIVDTPTRESDKKAD